MATKLSKNKKEHYARNALFYFLCCPTWIRTKTNSTKNCRTTFILSGKQLSTRCLIVLTMQIYTRFLFLQNFFGYFLDRV